jgi:hypothetical protein
MGRMPLCFVLLMLINNDRGDNLPAAKVKVHAWCVEKRCGVIRKLVSRPLKQQPNPLVANLPPVKNTNPLTIIICSYTELANAMQYFYL